MALKALYYPGNVPFDSLFIPAIYHEIYYDGIYMDIVNVLDKQKKDPVIVDVGANIGIVTQFLRDHAKKVYSIEPASEHFEALKKNKEHNGWDNVEVFKCAISDKNGEAQLRLFSPNRTSHSIVFKGENDKEFETVPTKTLNTFFKENKIKHVDFMKLDVEGAEEMIMRTKDFAEACKIIDVMEVEFHYQNYPELINIMIELGYEARRYPCSAIVVAFNKK